MSMVSSPENGTDAAGNAKLAEQSTKKKASRFRESEDAGLNRINEYQEGNGAQYNTGKRGS